jgi:hypothetical protein
MKHDVANRFWLVWCLLSACLAAVAYSYLSQAVFSDDDGHILQLAVDAPWLAAYVEPTLYQQLSVVHYTPVVLSIYRAMLEVWGLNPAAFVVLQLVMWALCAALAATWCQRQTRQASAGVLVVLMVVGTSSFWTMMGRFYTVHYLVGAVFSLLLLLWLQRKADAGSAALGSPKRPAPVRDSPLFLLGIGLLGLAAVLSKEVFLMLLPALVVSCLWLRQWRRALALLVALVVCLAMRLHVLGFSLEGRAGQGFVQDALAIDAATWFHFFKWYAQTHTLLLVLLAVALVRNPMAMLKWGGLASLLALPVLAAPHAIRMPDLHADRLFFAFDLALICAVALVLQRRPLPMNWRLWAGLPVLLGAVGLGHAALTEMAQKTAADPQQQITRQILAANSERPLTVFTDLDYQQGGLMRVVRQQSGKDFTITQNCQLALDHLARGQTLISFNKQGQPLDPVVVQALCQAWAGPTPPVTVLIAPTFSKGVLKWHLQAQENVQAGVMFPERGMSFGIQQLHQRIVRPRQDEPYRLFAHRQGQWWFSELRTMQLDAEQP